MWIDIGVTVLLTIRIALFRPALPQLLDPNNDAWLPEGKDEQQGCLFVVMEKWTKQIHRGHIMRKMEADSFATLVKLASKLNLESSEAS
jgi:hypothetical protein